MLYGMGTVVVFLALLVVVTTLMSTIVTRYFPEAEIVTRATSANRPTVDGAVNGEVVAAISAAIKQHRSKQQ